MHQCEHNLRIGQKRVVECMPIRTTKISFYMLEKNHINSLWWLTDYWSLNLSTRATAKGWRVKLVEGRRRTGIGVEMDNLTLFIRAPEYPISEASSVFGSFNEQAWVPNLPLSCHIVLHQMPWFTVYCEPTTSTSLWQKEQCCTSWAKQSMQVHSLLFRLVLGLICVVILLTLCLSVCHKTITACVTVNNGPRQDQVCKFILQSKQIIFAGWMEVMWEREHRHCNCREGRERAKKPLSSSLPRPKIKDQRSLGHRLNRDPCACPLHWGQLRR